MPDLQSIPSIEQLLQTRLAIELIDSYGRPLTVQAIRASVSDLRRNFASGSEKTMPDREGLVERARAKLRAWTAPGLIPVINATGVILHTNLGRAPLSTSAAQFMDAVARGYSNLELDLDSGKRGSRSTHADDLLQRLSGAEAGLVVNNNAAATLLILNTLARRRQVLIARSQLVEIGGGFRVPDVMKESGARLVEVGTTNRTHLEDYADALSSSTALILHVHRSNFKIVGFTEEPDLKQLANLAHQVGVLLVDDLGSGALLPTERYGLGHEPMVQESLKAGADLVCFSGDKLLGGPQSGIILGKAELVEKMKKHPLARALRPDKSILAALMGTLLHYLRDEAERKIPVWRMIALSPKQLKARAEHWVQQLRQGEIISGLSTIGGGSLPGETLPTWLLALDVKNPVKFLEKLRQQQPPVIARTEDDRILIDPRTVLPEQEGALIVNLSNVLGHQKKKK